ncbi:hypothetical protein [Nocardioides piscis]|uniref:Uncharacterized protein n=1 Tax=Nocardioides piscis TaxID=2714938 RepID=A0A6G7YK24_9ACTN|nr:hypothetical protein [Nocardioides piscis]QIK77087.1 hypothetical protein G7071_18250 [Nocardioides piscis]
MNVQIDYDSLAGASQEWRDLGELMDDTADRLSSATPGVFAPSVRGAAAAFLSAWQGFARDSAGVANGLADALELNVDDQRAVDDVVRDGFDFLLGPAG